MFSLDAGREAASMQLVGWAVFTRSDERPAKV
jgi:hypothetical protein